MLNKGDVERAVQNQDGVVVVLGTRNDLSPTTALSDGTQNIVDAMKAANIKRISCCISCNIQTIHLVFNFNNCFVVSLSILGAKQSARKVFTPS